MSNDKERRDANDQLAPAGSADAPQQPIASQLNASDQPAPRAPQGRMPLFRDRLSTNQKTVTRA